MVILKDLFYGFDQLKEPKVTKSDEGSLLFIDILDIFPHPSSQGKPLR